VAGYRTQLFNADDLDNVKKVQAGYKVQTLSAYLNQPATVGAAFPKIDKELGRRTSSVSRFRATVAPPRRMKRRYARLAKIGVGPGKTFNFKDLRWSKTRSRPRHEGERKIDEAVAKAGKAINGWRVSGLPGDSAHYNGDWLKRAAAAKAGIYGNDPAEATYPITRVDGDGRTLDGSKNNYTLTFPPGQQPPVNAFWSLTMYDGKSQLLIENPINRYLINSPMLPNMKTNPDGSLTLYIQNKSPGADKESNWLPAPNDTIYLVMRLYWPKTEQPSILPPGEGTWKPPAIVAAN
jgi:hypothetical protein